MNIFFDFVINGFLVTTCLLLIGNFIFKQHRASIKELNNLSGIFLLLSSLSLLISFAIGLIQLLNVPKAEQQEVYMISYNSFFGIHWWGYWMVVFCKMILPQLLWIKKVRRNIWISLAFIPFLFIDTFMVYWIRMIADIGQNYVPSTLNFYLYGPAFAWSLLFAIPYMAIVVLAFVLINKRKKTSIPLNPS
jgi:hypothetical protein